MEAAGNTLAMNISTPQTGKQTDREPGKRKQTPFVESQLILFSSRKKWGALYSLATVAGLLCVPGVLAAMGAETDLFVFVRSVLTLPLISLLVATGMYILNDLVDADLDRASGKNRPISSGMVSKKQVWIFVLSTNGIAVLLSIATLNPASMLIIAPMLTIGILYSAPRVALMNRFVVKTLAIASFYVLCALLGITSIYGTDLAAAEPIAPLYAMSLLGIMIFISSTLNDLGDVKGDRQAGRRTVPIVLGGSNTIRLLISLAVGMIGISWILYGHVSIVTLVSATLFALLLLTRLAKIRNGLKNIDSEAMRRQHRKIFPLHIVLQSILAAGAIIQFI